MKLKQIAILLFIYLINSSQDSFAKKKVSIPLEKVITHTTNCENNGSISLNTTFGQAPYSYKWSGPGFNETDYTQGASVKANLEVGDYQISVKDANNVENIIKAAVGVSFEWTNPIHASASDNRITHIGAYNRSGDSGISSVDILEREKSGYIDVVIDELKNTSYLIGFSTQDIDAQYYTTGYQLYHNRDGIMYIYANNGTQSHYFGAVEEEDHFRLHLSRTGDGGDGKIRLYKNGSVIWTQDLTEEFASAPLIADVSMGDPGSVTHPISGSFCGGFMVDVTSDFSSTFSGSASISLTPSLGQAPYSYKWSGPGFDETTYTEGASSKSNLNAGQYKIWVKDSNGKERLIQKSIARDIEWTNVLNATVSGNQLTPTSSGWGNSGASSVNKMAENSSGFIQLNIDQVRLSGYVVGFSTEDVDGNLNNYKYYLTHSPTGTVTIYFGPSSSFYFGMTRPGDIFRMDLSRTGDGGDGKIRVYRNGREVWSRDIEGEFQTAPLVVDVSTSTRDVQTHPITVSFPNISVDANVIDISCNGTSYQTPTGSITINGFDDITDLNDYDFNWFKDDQPYTTCDGLGNNSCQVTEAGLYKIKISQSGQVVVETEYQVNSDLEAGPVITADVLNICGTESATLSIVNPLGESIYQWYFNDEIIVGANSYQLLINSTQTGEYYAKIIIGEGCTSESSNKITITSGKVPTATISAGTLEICQNENVSVDITANNDSENGGSYIIELFIGDELRTFSVPSIEARLIITEKLTETTTFEIVSVTGPGGCKNDNLQESVTITVNKNTNLNLEVLTNPICEDQPIQIQTDFGSDDAFDITYEYNGITSSMSDFHSGDIIVIDNAVVNQNTFTVTSVNQSTSGCFNDDGNNVDFVVLPTPSISFVGNGGTTCFGDEVLLEFESESPLPLEVTYTDGESTYTHVINNEGDKKLYLNQSTTPSAPTISKTYRILSVSNSNGCQNADINSVITYSVNGMPTGYLTADNVCGDEEITLFFHKTFPVDDDPIDLTIEYSDGYQVFSPRTLSFANGEDVVDFKPYAEQAQCVTQSDKLTFSIISIKTSERTVNGEIIEAKETSGVIATQKVTINEQPLGYLSGYDQVCIEDEATIIFHFTQGKAPYTAKIHDSSIGTEHTFYRLEDGEARRIKPSVGTAPSDIKFSLVEITDANNCIWTKDPDNTVTCGEELNQSSLDLEVHVNALPLITSNIESIQGEICKGENFTITTSVQNPSSANYHILITDGENIFESKTGTSLSVSVSPNKSGEVKVLSVTDENGCQAEVSDHSKQLTVKDIPSGNFTLNDNFCANGNSDLIFNTVSGTLPFDLTYKKNGVQQPVIRIASDQQTIEQNITQENVSFEISAIAYTEGSICTNTEINSLVTANASLVTLTSEINTICNGESIELKLKLNQGCNNFDIEYSDGNSTIALNGLNDGDPIVVNPINNTVYNIVSVNGNQVPENSLEIKVQSTLSNPKDVDAKKDEENDKHIKITWTDDYDNETGFTISRSISADNDYILIGKTGDDATQFIDKTAEAGINYKYVVQALSGPCTSPQSDPAQSEIIYGYTFTSPLERSDYCVGTTLPISWEGALDNTNDITVKIFPLEEINPSVELGPFTNTTNSVDWTVAGADGEYQVKIYQGTNPIEASGVFSIASNCINPTVFEEGADRLYHAETHQVLSQHYHSTRGNVLRFRLEEKYDENQVSSAVIYDWRHEPIQSYPDGFNLLKSYGKNFYSLSMQDLGLNNANGLEQFYVLEIEDAINNDKRYLRFQYTIELDAEIALADINNPCGENPQITFKPIFPDINKKGHEEYEITWYISQSGDFESAGDPVKTHLSVLESDFEDATYLHNGELGYYIFMKVKDACGNEVIEKMTLSCENGVANPGNSINVSIIDVNQKTE